MDLTKSLEEQREPSGLDVNSLLVGLDAPASAPTGGQSQASARASVEDLTFF